MEEWKQYKLGEVAIPVKDKIETSCLDSTSYISTENMLPDKGGVTLSSSIPSSNAIMFKNEDILISNIRPYFRKIWRADKVGGCSTDIICLRASNVVEPLFLYYHLSQDLFFDYAMQGSKGTKMPRGDRNQIMQWPILLPSKSEQQKIASTLLVLDDKIELNRRINDNLEQQAQALFKSWFVDNYDPLWVRTKLSDVANFVGGYSYKGTELVNSSDTAMVTIKNFHRNGGFKIEGFKDITPSSNLQDCHCVDLFDILVAHTDLTQNAEVIGNAEVLLTYGKYKHVIFSMDLVKVVPCDNFPYRFLLAAMLRNKFFKAHCLGYVNGTTVLHLSKKALPEFEVRIPYETEAKTMNDALAPYYKKMAEVLQENDRLINLRDTLLPKLMSGELKIDKVNR